MVALEGLEARLEGENLVLFIQGDGEETLVMPALEFAEALVRLDEKPPSFMGGMSDESESFGEEPVAIERLLAPWQPPFPEHQPGEESYRAADVALIEPPGMLLLRRVFAPGEDILELNTPSSSAYEFPYTQMLEYLRDFLPR